MCREMHNHILGELWKLLWALLENCWKNYGALECLNHSEQWFHYISAKTQTLQSRYHMTMDFWRKMSPTIATKKLSRSEDLKNQGPTTQPRPRKNLHAQPVGRPKVCTTPCLTPTSTDGQTLLDRGHAHDDCSRTNAPAHVSHNTISSRQTQ